MDLRADTPVSVADAVADRVHTHLDAVHRLLTLDLLPFAGLVGEARLAELLDRLHAVRARSAGPDLNLVVVGEFSSGKSSLINAFVRERILPTSALETTAVPTEIHWRPRFSVQLRLEPDGRWLDADRDRPDWQARLPELSGLDARAVLAAVTADRTLADRVWTIRVTHPACGLGPGIVIMDTPGIAALTARRTERTTDVVRERADAVLVVVPANAAFSRTLLDYLAGPLGGHLDRCLFAVTKMDQIDPDESDRFVRSVHRSLAVTLGTPAAPLVYTVATAVLTGATGSAGDRDWAVRFVEAEATLREHLAERRQPPAGPPEPGPVRALLDDVDRELARAQYDVRALEWQEVHTAVADLETFSAGVEDASFDRLATLGSAARKLAWGTIARWRDDAARHAVEGELARVVQELDDLGRAAFQIHRNVLTARAGEVADEVALAFARAYDGLPGLVASRYQHHTGPVAALGAAGPRAAWGDLHVHVAPIAVRPGDRLPALVTARADAVAAAVDEALLAVHVACARHLAAVNAAVRRHYLEPVRRAVDTHRRTLADLRDRGTRLARWRADLARRTDLIR